jgi:hypothetical protein
MIDLISGRLTTLAGKLSTPHYLNLNDEKQKRLLTLLDEMETLVAESEKMAA